MLKGRRSKRRRSPAASLTEDLIVEILSHLPARSVCRFRCVSKTWRDLISAHHRKLPQTLTGFFTMHDGEMGVQFHASPMLFPAEAALLGSLPHSTSCRPSVYLQDCCNGLVLLCNFWWHNDNPDDIRRFGCNPATKEWVELPGSNLGDKCRGRRLGFDPTVSPHFFVFEFFKDDHDHYGVQVYSSETGQTVREENERDNGIANFNSFLATVFLNGCLPYLTNDPIPYLTNDPPAIAVVDTQGKARRSIPVPDSKEGGFIQKSQGRLHYANFEANDEDEVVRLVVYVLEDDDSQQWTLKHAAEASFVLRQWSSNIARQFEWVAIHPDCNMIFYTVGWDKTLMSYNMDHRRVQVICDLEQDTREWYLPYVPLFSELEGLHL